MKSRFYQTNNNKPRSPNAILVGVEFPGGKKDSTNGSLEELDGLATTAYYKPVWAIRSRLKAITPKTLLGSGKVEELLHAVQDYQADVVIFDEDLSARQNINLERILKCRVIDRSWLILEIFRDHARTREAKTQVELAQLKYALPRLTGMWGHLSRQRGGIGLRDVGETQIQLDRRNLRDRIAKLSRKLSGIEREKQTQKKSRQGIFKVALVGYTNVGKSSLMNLLTGAETRVEDKLFATLDTTTRKIKRNFPYPILLADTVGLIDKLPHSLVASFKSTLDEVRDADLLVKVVDISHPNYKNHIETTDRVLKELAAHHIPSIMVFNKIDLISEPQAAHDALRLHANAIIISCLNNEGLEKLQNRIIGWYEKTLSSYRLELNYNQGALVPEIARYAFIAKADYKTQGITLILKIPPHQKKKVETFLSHYAEVLIDS